MLRAHLSLFAVVTLLLSAGCGGGGPPSPTTPGGTSAASPAPTAASPSGAPGVSPPPGTPSPTMPPQVTPTPVAGVTYIVQAGDTLFSISRLFGVAVDAIVAANNLSDPNKLAVGQALIIPGATVIPTATPFGGVAQVIRKGSPARRMAAFTFDAGADAGYTAQILDTLKANGIKAGFGMTGRWAEGNPDLIRRIVSEGHSLINHSYDHPSFTGLSTGLPPLTREQRWDQLDRTESIVQQLTGATTKPYFRPPYGDYDQSVNEDVGARGYRYNIMWTVDSRGWAGLPTDQIVRRCLDLAEPGAIYVFHVGSASQDGPALQSVIDGLRAAGYEIGSVPDVIGG